jgi:hypothetical protein
VERVSKGGEAWLAAAPRPASHPSSVWGCGPEPCAVEPCTVGSMAAHSSHPCLTWMSRIHGGGGLLKRNRASDIAPPPQGAAAPPAGRPPRAWFAIGAANRNWEPSKLRMYSLVVQAWSQERRSQGFPKAVLSPSTRRTSPPLPMVSTPCPANSVSRRT